MTDNPTRLEAAHGSVVLAYCRDCPPWRALEASRPDALRAAADHIDRVHGMPKLASELRRRARTQDDTPT